MKSHIGLKLISGFICLFTRELEGNSRKSEFHYKQLLNLYSSLNIVKVVKLSKMRMVVHVAHTY